MAQYLYKHPQVERSIYPDLDNHPQYKLAKKQMTEGGSIVTLDVKNNKAFDRHIVIIVLSNCI